MIGIVFAYAALLAAVSAVALICWPWKRLRSLPKEFEAAAFASVFAVLALVMAFCTTACGSSDKPHMQQYQDAADSMLEGRAWLDMYVDPVLSSMEDPQDKDLRDALGVEWRPDTAFKDGRYYSYFGAGPAVVLFLPYRAFTGHRLPTHMAVAVMSVFYCVGSALLFYALSARFFGAAPFGTRLLLSFLCSLFGFLECVRWPSMYNVPLAWSIACCSWGFYFCFSSLRRAGGKFLRLGIGMAFLAASFAGRPTAALAGSLFMFAGMSAHMKEYFRREYAGKLLPAFSPYLLVGILLCLWNYARFGSFAEFGLKYQLAWYDQMGYIAHFYDDFGVGKLLHGLRIWFIGGGPETNDLYALGSAVPEKGVLGYFPVLGVLAFSFMKRFRFDKTCSRMCGTSVWVSLLIWYMTFSVSTRLWARYMYDVYYVLWIAAFLFACLAYSSASDGYKKVLLAAVHVSCAFCIFGAWSYFMLPQEMNTFAAMFGVDYAAWIQKLMFWL